MLARGAELAQAIGEIDDPEETAAESTSGERYEHGSLLCP